MKNILKLPAVAMLLAAFSAHALNPTSIATTGGAGEAIPDNNASGISWTFYLSTPSPLVVGNVTVDLNLGGGWNGDLYAYLTHDSGFSVLLNRVGSTAGNPGGSSVSGMNVHLSDAFGSDIHTAAGNPLLGNFSPDGRNVNPFGALNTDPRTAMLGSFNGANPNGAWTLFFADVSALSVSTVQSWAVNVTLANPVPEPATLSLLIVGIAAAASRRPRRK